MPLNILVFYGSYRTDRRGIRLAHYLLDRLRRRGNEVTLIDAKAIGLPMLDRMYKEYDKGTAPAAMESLAAAIRGADAFVFVVGEYNWGVQPGLKNLTDHFLEEWFWRPAAVASYSGGRLSGVRSATAWHGILSEMGMIVTFERLDRRPDQRDLGRIRTTDRPRRQISRTRICKLRRRPGLVGERREGATSGPAAALLTLRGPEALTPHAGCGVRRWPRHPSRRGTAGYRP